MTYSTKYTKCSSPNHDGKQWFTFEVTDENGEYCWGSSREGPTEVIDKHIAIVNEKRSRSLHALKSTKDRHVRRGKVVNLSGGKKG